MTELAPHHNDHAADGVDFHAFESATDLTNCDREPIHRSGAIQPHGVLLAVDEADLTVRWTSANTHRHLGVAPADLLGGPLARAVGDAVVATLRVDLAEPHVMGPTPVTCRLPAGDYEITWHRVAGSVLLECEPAEAMTPATESARSVSALRSLVALQSSDDVSMLCEAAAVEVRRLTGYDRVMVYRFHADHHGEVVAEDHAPGMEPFLGLHYPASDIPRQARKLYLLNHLRVIADVDYEPVPLMGRVEGSLDLSLAGLRSVSPMHLAYLRNMGVQATLTISLMRGSRLWGMIACHHQTPKNIDARLRADCTLLAQTLSQHLAHLDDVDEREYRDRLATIQRRLLSRLSGARSPAAALVTGAPSPLGLTAADGMVARIDGRTVTVGSVPPPRAVADLLNWLRAHEVPTELVCHDLSQQVPALAPFAGQAAGVLASPLSPAFQDYLLWFRGEQVSTIDWAGDPDAAMLGDPNAPRDDQAAVKVGPRVSFAAFRSEVRGRSRPWLPAEIESARELAEAIPRFQLANARSRLADRALRDPITGLPNEALILRQTADVLQEHERGGPWTVALLCIDLDEFGRLNESLGRLNGDQILRQAGERLKAAVGDRHHLAHAGGDDFVVLCENVTSEQVMRFAGHLVEQFQTPFMISGSERRVVATASIGIGTAELHPGAMAEDLLGDATTAMSRVKEWGRNSAAMYCP